MTRLIESSDVAEVERTLDAVIAPHLGVSGARPADRRRLPVRYDPRLLNTTQDVEELCEGLAGATRATVCLHGPPGTGKTMWVHHLGARLGRQVITRRGSDLLSMWVGQSERQVADAFQEAAADRTTILFLDEVESFLLDRRGARASWEVSLTNEVLGWLDHAQAVVVAATNRLEMLDPAVLRRFDVKVGFEALRAEQRSIAIRAALERLGVPEWPADAARRAARMHGLTLGDVEAATRHCELTRAGSAARLLDTVERELAVKRSVGRVGFGQAG